MKRLVIFMGIVSMLLGLFGCGRKPEPDNKGADPSEIRGLLYHQTNDDMQPYYVIRENKKGGFEFVISWANPLDCDAAGEDAFAVLEKGFRLPKGQKSRKLRAEELEALETVLKEENARAWDGFNKRVSLGEDVLDGGDSFELMILYRDGSRVQAEGSHARPEGFDAFYDCLDRMIYSEES